MNYQEFYDTITPMVVTIYNPAESSQQRYTALAEVCRLQLVYPEHAKQHYHEITNQPETENDG